MCTYDLESVQVNLPHKCSLMILLPLTAFTIVSCIQSVKIMTAYFARCDCVCVRACVCACVNVCEYVRVCACMHELNVVCFWTGA